MDSPVPPKNSGLAITSLILGLLSPFCCGVLTGIPAIITGHLSRSRIKSSGGMLKGDGMALTGLITGYLSVAISALVLFAFLPHLPEIMAKAKLGGTLIHGVQVTTAITKTGLWPADSGLTDSTAFIAALVEKNGLTKAEADALHPEELLIGNVSAEDPAKTILVRSRPGVFKDGSGFVITKDNNFEFVDHEDAVKGSLPPREPNFLKP